MFSYIFVQNSSSQRDKNSPKMAIVFIRMILFDFILNWLNFNK